MRKNLSIMEIQEFDRAESAIFRVDIQQIVEA
jgi:hypothetical protein